MHQPQKDCPFCPRLVSFREENKKTFPEGYNGAVPSFGDLASEFLIVGLAPGLQGASYTGRPFTADWAGDLLYETLLHFDFASGEYQERADDRLSLRNTRITNAVRCVPPQNKPNSSEINQCRFFLKSEIENMENLKIILALGSISHKQIISCFELKHSSHPFIHGKAHTLSSKITLIDSYHCSRYNTNTGKLTKEMFFKIFEEIQALI